MGRQVTHHLRHEGFTPVAAYACGSMVGFGYTFPCTPEYWYDELLPEIPEHVRAGRLMTCANSPSPPPGGPGGIGPRLHAELLKSINTQWSSLLVRPDNTAGRRLYELLGYTYAAPYRNEPDGPVYELLLLQVDRETVAQ
ncbi:hypothetical protein M2271_003224 [Streptomyces sp. LBL]|uniref:hypothetical protein n=1 Tax=Streptomyces sp. LBL TaxID=2940562 RepID=UPI0024743BB7|nr:hypothetical protein [Streptomyces sp. LBL]MDH6625413.1 hypothetical protein [Streptomyces sp. LBL]